MPAWSATTQAALSSGDNLQVLLATEAIAAGAGLKGFAFTGQPTSVFAAFWNNSGATLALQASPDNVNWLTVYFTGTAVTVATGDCGIFAMSSGLNYRLYNAGAIAAGGTVWVAR